MTLLFLYLVTGRIAPNDTALTFADAFSTMELVAGNRVEIGDVDRRRVGERAIPCKKVWRRYSPRLYTLALFPQDSCTSRLSHPIGYITRPPHIITAVTRKWYKMHDNKLTLATKRFSVWKVWEINSVELQIRSISTELSGNHIPLNFSALTLIYRITRHSTKLLDVSVRGFAGFAGSSILI